LRRNNVCIVCDKKKQFKNSLIFVVVQNKKVAREKLYNA